MLTWTCDHCGIDIADGAGALVLDLDEYCRHMTDLDEWKRTHLDVFLDIHASRPTGPPWHPLHHGYSCGGDPLEAIPVARLRTLAAIAEVEIKLWRTSPWLRQTDWSQTWQTALTATRTQGAPTS